MLRSLQLLVAVLVLYVPPTCFADTINYSRLRPDEVEHRVQNPPSDQKARLQSLKEQFLSAGCPTEKLTEQTIPGQTLPNVICTLSGLEGGAIVMGANLGAVADGEERWATVSVLPLLVEAVHNSPHRHKLVFIAFGGDSATAGSSYYYQQLSEVERKQILAMVNLEQVGRGPLTYAFPPLTGSETASIILRLSGDVPLAHRDNILGRLLPAVANALTLPIPSEIDATTANATQPFDDAYILAVTLSSAHGVPNRTDTNAYYDTYNLLCLYTLVMDLGLSPPKAPKTNVLVAQTKIPEKRIIESEIVASVHIASPSANSFDTSVTYADATTIAELTPSTGESGTRKTSSDGYKHTGTVFRATTRLVQLDVVATDSKGNPIERLKQGDFSVLQDGKVQAVKVFEEHRRGDSSSASDSKTSKAPEPGTYSNFPPRPAETSWNVVMFDMLNTDTKDQQSARQQLVRLIRNLPAGVPVALFTLTGNQLEMVHAFTTDSGSLEKTAAAIRPVRSPLLQTEAQRQQEVGQEESEARLHVSEGIGICAPGAQSGSSGNANSPSGPSGVCVTPQAMDAVREGQMRRQQQAMRDTASFQADQRARFTLEAFRALARSVSGYPGRKNLIWLSGSFPMQMEPDINFKERTWWNTADYRDQIRQVGALIAASRVAVYPVDVRGLTGRGIDISTTAKASESYLMPDYAVSLKNAASPDFQGALLDTQVGNTMNELASMRTIADQTGGHAFVNGNDIQEAIKRSIENGSAYYTLAYTPELDEKNGGTYHRLEVKLARSGVTLSYRRGYYSEPPAGTRAQGTAALQAAVQPGMPQSTMVYVSVMARTADGLHKGTRLLYRVNANGLTFAESISGTKHVQIECLAVAYDTKGREAKRTFDILDSDVDAAELENVMSQGVPVEQEMQLPAGQYNVRIGVMDRATQRIGTVDVPLVVPAQVAAK